MQGKHGLIAFACCEKADLSLFGIDKSSCIDRVFIEEAIGCRLDINKDKNQREGCGCYESIDIGSYDNCPSGCVYCYANRSYETAVKRFSQHDPQGELLFGRVNEGEIIRDRKVKSNKLPPVININSNLTYCCQLTYALMAISNLTRCHMNIKTAIVPLFPALRS